MKCAKQGSQQLWMHDSASCICSSKQPSSGDGILMANDRKQWQMANDGERWQTMANKESTNNCNSKLNKKQQSTVGDGNSDNNSNSAMKHCSTVGGKGGNRKNKASTVTTTA